MHDELFAALDGDADGRLTPQDLLGSARRLGWHWREAPIYAVLHRFALDEPLLPDTFAQVLDTIRADPLGPYGEVLERLRWRSEGPSPGPGKGLLIIDPQRSFTQGAWMRSIGSRAEDEVQPIRAAFLSCAAALRGLDESVRPAFTRCPFPPESYDWDETLGDVLPPEQAYFVKPGNSALWPPTNGYVRWIEELLDCGRATLTIGGCTLNSCVRITALETQQRFGDHGLEVVVDLSLCGARAQNYRPSPLFGGLSSVEATTRELRDAGVRLVAESR
jgi:hypothetical protein